jgi:hypothetical protein
MFSVPLRIETGILITEEYFKYSSRTAQHDRQSTDRMQRVKNAKQDRITKFLHHVPVTLE